MDPEDKESPKVVEEEEEKTGVDDDSENPNRNQSVDPNLEKSLKRGLPESTLPLPPTVLSVSPPKKLKSSVSVTVPKIEEAGPSTANSTSTTSLFLPKEGKNITRVLKKIFSYLDTKTLLECRLMSSTADSIASTTLFSKRLKLQFQDLKLQHNKSSQDSQDSEKKLSGLTQLLKISRELKLVTFPCRTFGFLYNTFESSQYILGNLEFQNFISQHGERVVDLSITYIESTPPCPCTESTETDIMDQVRHLLVHQTPNLRFFEFGCPPIIPWKDTEYPYPTESSSPLIPSPSDPETQQTKEELQLNTNLRVLKFSHLIFNSSKIVETVIELCPLLEAIFTGVVDPLTCCLLQPINRLHLIKQMTIDNDSDENLEDHIYSWPFLISHPVGFGLPVRMLGIHWSVFSDLDPALIRDLEVILKQMLAPGVELICELRSRPDWP